MWIQGAKLILLWLSSMERQGEHTETNLEYVLKVSLIDASSQTLKTTRKM